MKPNWRHQTLWTGDNLGVMRGMNSETVDLVYLDPPFDSNKDFSAPIGSIAAGAAFKDTWTPGDLDTDWLGRVASAAPKLYRIVDTAGQVHGDGMQSYLTMMAVRLLEIRRLLKDTGSVYLHCDPTASHYLKVAMDAIFGVENFRNDLTWRRATAHNDAGRFGNIVDNILFYVKSADAYWNGEAISTRKTAEQLAKLYPSRDERGRYRSSDLTGPLHNAARGSPSTRPWRGYDVHAMGRCWSVPKTGRYARYIEENLLPGYMGIDGIHERLDALDGAGLIHHPRTGRWPGLKRYAAADEATPPQSLILDPIGFTNFNKGKEYTGYPTQKPVKLLRKLIEASCPPGGMVLDPFCGCATACIAAEGLGRRWAGIDLSVKAVELVKSRMKAEMPLLTLDLRHGTAPPERQDLTAPEERYFLDASKPERERPYNCDFNKERLFGNQRGVCNTPFCGRRLDFELFEVDHVVPRSKGGGNELANLQLLCAECNRSKGDDTMEDFVARRRDRYDEYVAAQRARYTT